MELVTAGLKVGLKVGMKAGKLVVSMADDSADRLVVLRAVRKVDD